MKTKVLSIVSLFVLFTVSPRSSKRLSSAHRHPTGPPPRIIRTCCAFGSDLKISGIPFKKITEVTSFDKIGKHVYLGDKSEGNGIVYTERGGFIDLGHLRDIADWTNYLYHEIIRNKGKERIITLGREGGKKTLTLWIPQDLSDQRAASLAGRIAYDLSVWHEIGTWFGTSYIPFVPERYSAFSPEDQYSNLTGAVLGVAALQSGQPYEEAMTKLLHDRLIDLNVVKTRQATLDAMENVVGDWWTRDKKLPSKKVLIKRYVVADSTLVPWVVPQLKTNQNLLPVSIPAYQDVGLAEMYELDFKLNRKFPIARIFPERGDRCISQRDFPAMIRYIEAETDVLQFEIAAELEKVQRRKERRAQRRKNRRN